MRFAVAVAFLVLTTAAACGSDSEPETFADPHASYEPHRLVFSLVFSGSADDDPVDHLYASSGADWKVRRLPAACDGISSPVWSPSFDHVADESGIVLASDGTGQRELHVYLRPGLPWSSDGTELVYMNDAYEEGDILVVPVTGSKARTIARGRLPSWAPDGRIYFEHGAAIEAVDPRSGRREGIASSEQDWLLFDGAWSRDGRRVAHTRGMEGEGTLWELEPGKSDQPKQLLANVDPPVLDVRAYAWSSDGEHLAVIAGRDDQSAEPLAGGAYGVRWELHIVDVDEDDSHGVLDIEAHALSWSPDGQWIALERPWGLDAERHAASDIWVVHPDGTGLRRITNGRVPGTDWDHTTGTDYGSAAWVPESVVARAMRTG